MGDAERRILPGGFTDTSLADLRSAREEREREAVVLMSSGCVAMALALRLYALEIAVKIRICEVLDLDLLPASCKTHDLTVLLPFSGCHRQIRSGSDPLLTSSWDALANFSKQRLNDMRYVPSSALEPELADKLLKALDDPEHGVLSCLHPHPSS